MLHLRRLLAAAPVDGSAPPAGVCLLTVTGAGGVGKTRLALEVARAVAPAYPDGAWLVELAPLSDPALVPEAVAAALGVAERPGWPVGQALADHLRPNKTLLVLDNCEHVADACARLVEALLRAAPGLTVLATGREPLGLTAETVWRLAPLDAPAHDEEPAPPDLLRYDAVRLFVERAGAVNAGVAVTGENASAIARICWRLDGIPLALELAARAGARPARGAAPRPAG